MAIRTLFISSQQHNWHKHPSKLLNLKNLGEVTSNLIQQDFHCSIEDITIENLPLVFAVCNNIDVSFFDCNNVDQNNYYDYGRLVNEIYKHCDKLVGQFDFEQFSLLPTKTYQSVDSFKTKIWVAGCSITESVGVEPDQGWPNLLAHKVNLPLINLSKSGSSNFLIADQILRSDIQPNDIVVVGITSFGRVELCNTLWSLDGCPVNVYTKLSKSTQYHSLDYFSSKNLHLKNLQSLFQIENFCKKIGSHLILINFLDALWSPVFFRNRSNFLNLVSSKGQGQLDAKFVDLGFDNLHPGPQQHQLYCDQIFNSLNNLNFLPIKSL